jgi:UDP-N-acetylglucosamine kinase
MDYLDWARKHKKKLAREFIRKVEYEVHEQPAGIFTAGLPGAGKTEFTQELLKNIIDPTLRIDMDEIAQLIEGYSPMKANLFRSGASVILAKIYDEVTKTGLDFIFDGTFAHDNALKNLQRAIDHKYITKLYYIHQEPEVAWKFTKDRELVEKRSIDREGFIATYYRLHENLRLLQENYKDVTISVIVKDASNKIGEIFENVENIYQYIPRPLDRKQLERVILN